MNTIWKYPIPIQNSFELELPERSAVLCVQVQHDQPCIWALVNSEASLVKRKFLLLGTGQNAGAVEINTQSYIGTFQLREGNLMFHLFDCRLPKL